MFIWSCGGLAPFLMRMICCEDGRSQDAEAKPAPFNSLTAANGITLKAGESLLLKAGATCTSATQTIDGASVKTGLRVINSKGAKDAPITIGAYGEGAAPIIAGAGVSETILLKNSEYITVQGFEVTNTDANAADYEKYMRRGIAVDARQRRQHEEQRRRWCHSAPEVRTKPDRRRSLRRNSANSSPRTRATPSTSTRCLRRRARDVPSRPVGDARKSNDDTPSTLKVQVKSNLASLGAVSSFSQYRKTVLSETVDAESKEGGKIHYSGSCIVPLDVDPYAALWVAISQTDPASGSFAYIDNVTLVEDSAAESDVASIAVTTQPIKTEYAIGDALDLSGMVVTTTMSDGTTAELGEGEYTVSEFDSSTAGEKTITVTYAADTSLTATLKVTVKEAEPVDTVPPVISGADDVAVEFGASFDPMAGVKAVDDVYGDVTGAVKVSGDTVDTSKPGAYTLVYTVSDAAGNEASVTRVATVKAKSGETPVEPGDKESGKEPGKDTDKDGDKNDQGNKKPGLSATDASVSVVAITAIGLLATGAVSVAVRRRRDI